MTYRFHAVPELYWSVVTSAATVLLLALVSFDPTTIDDWQTWLVALGAGMLRSAAGAALDWIRRSMTAEPAPTLADRIFDLTPAERKTLADEVERRGRSEAQSLITRSPEWLPPEPR